MARKPVALVKRYNADGSLSILARGRVQTRLRAGSHSSADAFAKGWFGEHPVRWGRPQFRFKQSLIDEGAEVLEAIEAGEY